MDGNKVFRVFNRCNYDIGVTLTSGQKPNIRKGSFLPLSVNDILYIESIARRRRPFSSGELVAVTDDGKDLKLADLGGYEDTYTAKHFNKDEIMANLKKSAKQVETWLNSIDDPIELHAIKEAAEKIDLPASKLRLLQEKLPDIDLLRE
jgi:hypothetical protein